MQGRNERIEPAKTIQDSPERYILLSSYAKSCGISPASVYHRYSVSLVRCEQLYPKLYVDLLLSAKPAARDHLRCKRIRAVVKKQPFPKVYLRPCGAYRFVLGDDHASSLIRDHLGRFSSPKPID